MIEYTSGNLLESDADAVVNTVNTVGVMGKGIALMFKDNFPENFRLYADACKRKDVQLGKMFVTETKALFGPKWIINFPTKGHWRYPSKIEWIEDGLNDLRRVLCDKNIGSVAIPPLGAGNGGLEWPQVREVIENALGSLDSVKIIVYEPTSKYQNVSKPTGVEKLTPARALIADLVRQYSVLGIECTLLEVQKLGYFLERQIVRHGAKALAFNFEANRYGPYSDKLKHMLNALDGSYLQCEKRLGDAGPNDIIRFNFSKREKLAAYIKSEVKDYHEVLAATATVIDGFESPLSMELLSTVDWLVEGGTDPDVSKIIEALSEWPAGKSAAARKLSLFDARMISVALQALGEAQMHGEAHA